MSCCSRTPRGISNHGSYDWALPTSKEEIEAWRQFLLSIGAREVEHSLIHNELTEIKPMELPAGLLFYLDYKEK